MELLQLYYFKTVAEFQHVSKAAEHLHVAQPALSQAIKRLESEFETNFFDRTGKNIVLNEKGRILLKYTNQVFSALDNAKDEIADCCERSQKTLTISIRSAASAVLAMLPDFRALYPDVDIVLHQITESKSKKADIEIYSAKEAPEDDHHCILLKERVLLALPSNHPLAKKDVILLEDLQEESFIKLSQTSKMNKVIEQYLQEVNFTPETSICCDIDNLDTLLPLVEKNLGLAFISEVTSYESVKKSDVVLREVQGQQYSRLIILSWNPEAYKSKMITSFCQIAVNYFENL